jgi:hypothetical protein
MISHKIWLTIGKMLAIWRKVRDCCELCAFYSFGRFRRIFINLEPLVSKLCKGFILKSKNDFENERLLKVLAKEEKTG